MVVSRAKSEHVTKENGTFYCLYAGRTNLVSARTSQFTAGFSGILFSAGLHEAVEKQKCLSGRHVPTAAYWECSSAGEQDTGPPTSACTPRHRDPRGPQPRHWVSLSQLTRSQADLGRDPLKRPHSSLIALGRLSPVPRLGTERAGTVLGPWEPLPKLWPCSQPHGKGHRPLLPPSVPPLPLT